VREGPKFFSRHDVHSGGPFDLSIEFESESKMPFMRTLLILASLVSVASVSHAETLTVWIGTTTPRGGESQGIYRAEFDTETGNLTQPTLAAEISSPGFLTQHPTLPILYSVCNLPEGAGPGVAAWKISEAPTLKLINAQPISDGGATHLAVDAQGRYLFTAQYGSGSVAMFPIDNEGQIQPRCDLQKHSGQGPDPSRQKSPHPHWVGVDPSDQFLMVPDLGIDQVVIYKIDRTNHRLVPHGSGSVPPGAGPRHMKFHPDGKQAYVLNEMALSVTEFDYSAKDGTLTPRDTVIALPEDKREIANTASEIRIHPDGRLLFTANRGHDSISAFRIDDTGKLTLVEQEPIRGSWPRNFNLDPTGRWLIVAGRNSNSLTLFSIDQETGNLIWTGKTLHCPTPICVHFEGH
jgi:6-phosphogluconolactonase